MCNKRPEIERYHVGEVIPAMVGHYVTLISQDWKSVATGVIDWGLDCLRDKEEREYPIAEGAWLVHHPERCNG